MAGNSQRRGAKRNPGSKKGQTVGSGGQSRRALRGKGPTPKATERTAHPAARRAASAARRAEETSADRSKGGPRTGAAGRTWAGRTTTGRGTRTRSAKDSPETVTGRNPVVEALRAEVPASALYVATKIDADDRVKEALKLANELGIPLLESPRGDLDRMSAGAMHQGLVLQVPPYEYAEAGDLVALAEDAGQAPLLVALDGVTDPRNLGAVVRSVAAFGGHGVVVPERRAAGMTAAAWRTSAGAAARVPVARVTNLTRALEDYKKAGLFVAGLDADGDVELDALEVAVDPLVLVVGSEGRGLSRLVRETCDMVVSIPMTASTESLNAGVAAGVVLYEVARRRRTP
jgi:23S rRNA (guanosine2251-2'-O)-methyltransferase